MLKIFKKGKGLASLVLLAALVLGIMVPAGAALANPPAGKDAAFTTPQHVFVVTSGANFDIPVTIDSGANSVGGYQVGLTWSGASVNCTGADYGTYMSTGTAYPGTPAAGTTGIWGKATAGTPGTGSGLAITFHFHAVSSGIVSLSYDPDSAVDDNTGTAYANLYTDGNIKAYIDTTPADLVVTGLTPTWITEGSTYSLAFNIKNQGGETVPLCYYKIAIDGSTVATGNVTNLGANVSKPVAYSPVTLSGSADAITVTADPDNLVIESTDQNNSATTNWGLLIMGIGGTPASQNVGQTFTANVTVSTGQAKTRGAEAVVTFDPAVFQCTGVTEGNFYSTWAGNNGAITQFFTGTIDNTSGNISGYGVDIMGGPAGDGPSGAGTIMVLHFKAIVASSGSDIAAAVGSTVGDVNGNELPGLSMRAATVAVAAPTYYDLVIDSASASVSTSGNQTLFSVTYTVKNAGNKATPNTFDCGILVNGQLLEHQGIAQLNGSGTSTKTSGPWPVPNAASVVITVVADYFNNNNAESNENNNTWSYTLGKLPDYIVSAKYETNTAPGKYSITYTIANVGDAAATVNSTTKIEADGVLVANENCPILTSGQSYSHTITNVSLSGDSDVVVITADATNVIVESDETNNVRDNSYSPNNVNNQTQIIGSVNPQIEITCPNDILDFVLNIGSNTASGVLNVKANTAWQVEASDENGVTHGQMTQWSGVAYGVDQLADPMVVVCDPTNVELPGPGMLMTGDPTGQFLNDGQDFSIDFNQEVYFSDPVAVYRIVVSFTAGVTF